ncbi:MAG: hypothetical protein CMJ77_14485 [Planctomycetaceae bacterium]|nr:hypothetical protein [Planctomycetaceae bacterium]
MSYGSWQRNHRRNLQRLENGSFSFPKLVAESPSRIAPSNHIDDAEPLKSIAASTEQNEYGVRSMIRQLVLSELFRTR